MKIEEEATLATAVGEINQKLEKIINEQKEIKTTCQKCEEKINKLQEYMEFVVKKMDLSNASFNIIFVSNEEIHNINKEYRNVDRVTDVISFALEDNKDITYDNFRLLGDIYIAIDVAYEQAKEYNHSEEREVCFLATHGLLHLLGYDHMKESDEKIMFGKQEELLNAYEIKR